MNTGMLQLSSLTLNQILLLNPDPEVLRQVDPLVRGSIWQQLCISLDEKIVWGICQKTAKNKYVVTVDLDQFHWSACNGYSNIPPCTHVLSLLCMWVLFPERFTKCDPHQHENARGWLRRIKAKKRGWEQRKKRLSLLRNPVERDHINQTRKATMEAGFEALELWLINMLKHGIADEQIKDIEMWDKWAARMIDVDAPAVSARLSCMKAIVENDAKNKRGRSQNKQQQKWQNTLLVEMSHLYLLLHSFKRFDALSPAKRADLRTAVGWHHHSNESTNGTVVEDDWVVLGECEETIVKRTLRQRRTWLRGINSGKDALLVQFAAEADPFGFSFKAGDVGHGELVYRPSDTPLEAFVQSWCEVSPDVQRYANGRSVEASWNGYKEAAAGNPWLTHFPFLLEDVEVLEQKKEWIIRDSHDKTVFPLPLSLMHMSAPNQWNIVSVTGNRPVRLAAEWDGQELQLIGMMVDDKMVDLPERKRTQSYSVNYKAREVEPLPEQLMSIAIVGTDATYEDVTSSTPMLSNLATHLPNASPEQLLLLGIANWSLRNMPNQPLRKMLTNPLIVAPMDRGGRPHFTDEMLGYFNFCCTKQGGRGWTLFLDFIRLASAYQFQVPDTHLANIINVGAKKTEWQEEILSLMGEHGLWFAKTVPKGHGTPMEWDWIRSHAPNADHEKLYMVGLKRSADEKVYLFKKFREHHPEKARLSMKQFGDHIDWLSTGLTMQDEPYIEESMRFESMPTEEADPPQTSHRGKPLSPQKQKQRLQQMKDMKERQRQKKQDRHIHLLAQLPNSRFCQRMIERIEKHISVHVSPSQKGVDQATETAVHEIIRRLEQSPEFRAYQQAAAGLADQKRAKQPTSREMLRMAQKFLQETADPNLLQRMLHGIDSDMVSDLYIKGKKPPPRMTVTISETAEQEIGKQCAEDETMKWDGLDYTQRKLEKILSYVPPNYWYQKGITPKQLVNAFVSAKSPRFCDPLLALYRSAIYAQDEHLLLEIISNSQHHQRQSQRYKLSAEMLNLLSSELLRKIAQHTMENTFLNTHNHPAKPYLQELSGRKESVWNRDLMQAFINLIKRCLENQGKRRYLAEQFCDDSIRFNYNFPISMKEPLLAVLALAVDKTEKHEQKKWSDAMHHVAFWMTFREGMYSAIVRAGKEQERKRL